MEKKSALLAACAVTFSFQLLAFSLCCAQDITCDFASAPSEIAEGSKFEVTVEYDLAGTDKANMNLEMKSVEHAVLKSQKAQVKGKGKKTFSFVAPKLADLESVIMAVWLGEDWQNPLAEIKFTEPILLAENKGSAAEKKEEKKEAVKPAENKAAAEKPKEQLPPAAGKVMLQDDFSKNADSWEVVSGTWDIQNGEYVCADEANEGKVIAGSDNWADIVYEFRVKTDLAGADPWNTARPMFRFVDSGNTYFVLLHTTKVLEFGKEYQGQHMPNLATAPNAGDPMQWNTIRIEIKGATIKISVNGKQKIDYKDPEPIESGKVGMMAAGCQMRFDDARVSQWAAMRSSLDIPKVEEQSIISVKSASNKIDIFSKSEIKESGEPPGKEALCLFAELPEEAAEGKEFKVTVDYSVPSSAGSVKLNCELKDQSSNVLRSESPTIKGKGKATFIFTAPEKAIGKIVIAAWMGDDWRQPLADIQFSEPIPVVTEFKTVDSSGISRVVAEKGQMGNIAVFKDNIPGFDASLADSIATGLRKKGFGVTFVDCSAVRPNSILTTDNFDCLIIANAEYFPVESSDGILKYLRKGGDLVTLGGYALREPVWKYGDKWMTKSHAEEMISSTQPDNVIFDFEEEPSGWRRATNDTSKPGSIESDKGYKGKGAKIYIPALTGWDNWSNGIAGLVPAGHNLVCFWAKGSPRTKQLAVEIDEKDGSRWIAMANISDEWGHYALTPDAFQYWKDNASKGRGARGDCVNLENATIINLGLAFTHNSVEGGEHAIWVDEIGTAKSPYPKFDLTAKTGIPVFNDAYQAYKVKDVTAKINPAQALLEPGLNLSGVSGGDLAIAFPDRTGAVYFPLISAYDRHGRNKGALAGVLVNFSKTMKNSVIACFGITDSGFYKDPSFAPALAGILAKMKNGLFMGSVNPGRLTYEPEKTAEFSAQVCNLGSAQKKIYAAFSVVKSGREIYKTSQEVLLEPGSNQALKINWATLKDAGEYVLRVAAQEAPGVDAAVAEQFFYVEPMPKTQAGFIAVSADKKHLVYPGGKRFFCLGSNYHGWFDRCWNEWKEYFDPVKMELDFRKAHEYGINTFRLFLYKLADDIMKDKFDKIDTMLVFAKRYDIHLLVHLARYGEMAKSQECIRKLCNHLKDEPMVLGYDIQNEPYLPGIAGEKYPAGVKLPILDIPDGINKFSVYIGENIGEWTTFPKMKDGKVPMIDSEIVKAGDESFRIWIKLNKDAIREVDNNHLVTVGFNTPFSAFPCASELDFISHHVYVRPFSYDSVLQNITTFDRIAQAWPGKPVSFGEFGYSNGIVMGKDYLDFYASSVGEMIHYLYPLSRGYEGSYKWMLNDNPNAWRGDNNFYEERFGFFYYDGTPFGRPKPVALAMKALSGYISRAGCTGTLEIAPAKGQIGTGYVFKGNKAFFVGNTEYKSDALQFAGSRPANVMLDWGSGKSLKITSTADLQIRINPSKFLSTLPSSPKITGALAGSKKDGSFLLLDLLEGEGIILQ